MKHSLLRLSVLALLLTINTVVFASIFEVNGIKYNTTSSSTVIVYSKSPKYSGNVVINISIILWCGEVLNHRFWVDEVV